MHVSPSTAVLLQLAAALLDLYTAALRRPVAAPLDADRAVLIPTVGGCRCRLFAHRRCWSWASSGTWTRSTMQSARRWTARTQKGRWWTSCNLKPDEIDKQVVGSDVKLSLSSRFITTNTGSGHAVPGARYKEYHLPDYSSWFIKQLNDTEKWTHLRSCLVKSDDCNSVSKRYKTLKQYMSADLTPIESGCCRPPAECGYPALNASNFDLSFHPVSKNVDCKLYKNGKSVRCYDCNSCKAGVAQYIEDRVASGCHLQCDIVCYFVLLVVENRKKRWWHFRFTYSNTRSIYQRREDLTCSSSRNRSIFFSILLNGCG